MLLRSILIRDEPMTTAKASDGPRRAWLEGREPSVLIAHSSADAYGSDRACLEVAMAARDAGYRVCALVPTDGPLVRAFEANAIDSVVIDPLVVRRADLRVRRILPTLLFWPLRVARLAAFARRERFDVVYSSCAVTLGGRYLSRKWRVAHVWHIHELLPAGVAGRVFERLIEGASAIVTCSDAVAEQFRSTRIRAVARTAHTGSRVPETTVQHRPFTGPSIEVVCVGRLNGWKGQGILIDAVGLLRSRGFDAQLTLVGDAFGGQTQFRDALIRQVASLGLKGQVRLLGFQENPHQFVEIADAVVIPSVRPEPFGMTLIEAMALGRPVIATNAGGPAEIIENGSSGILVAPGSAAAIADAVEALALDPARAQRIGELARVRAAQFVPERMTRVVVGEMDRLTRAANASMQPRSGYRGADATREAGA
jgi:glycosyltransferase involved in cell wall biosynthesis